MLYIHLSGRELARKLERGTAEIHGSGWLRRIRRFVRRALDAVACSRVCRRIGPHSRWPVGQHIGARSSSNRQTNFCAHQFPRSAGVGLDPTSIRLAARSCFTARCAEAYRTRSTCDRGWRLGEAAVGRNEPQPGRSPGATLGIVAAYSLAMLRALAVVWLFAGLRRNEIRRLRVGCIRWQRDDVVVPGTDEVLP
jgi:integrase